MWYLSSLLMLFLLISFCTIVGRVICLVLPFQVRSHAKLYLSPALGLAFFLLIATLTGWLFGFKSWILVASLTIGTTAIAVYLEKQKKLLVKHLLTINLFALLSSFTILLSLLIFNSYNSFNDSFTYLVHSQWLQTHAFAEPVTSSGNSPALTQVFLYQQLQARMGSSFLLGWVQSLFKVEWSYYVYPVVITIPFVTGSLAVGYCASLFGFRKKWHGFLIGLFVANSFNGFSFGTFLGFLPQTYGMSFATAFLGLIGSLIINTDYSQWKKMALWVIPPTLLFSAMVYSYSEIAPFVTISCLLAVLVLLFILDRESKKKMFLLTFFFLIQSVTVLNTEIFRAIHNIRSASGALVGWAFDWSLLGFIGHAFGLHDGSSGHWFAKSKIVSLVFLSLLLVSIILFIKHLIKERLTDKNYRSFIPCLMYLLVSTIAFLYFRYAVPTPWPVGTGQSWSQFKIIKWAGPFFIAIAGAAFLYSMNLFNKFSRVLKVLFVLIISVGIIQNYYGGKRLAKNFSREVGNRQAPYEALLGLQKALKDRVSDEQVIFLHPEEAHLAFRRTVTYFLMDFKLASDWRNDGYLYPWLPSSERNIPETNSDFHVKFNHHVSQKNSLHFGNLVLMPGPQYWANLTSVEGGYLRENDGKNWWYWTKESVTFNYHFQGKNLPKQFSFKCQLFSKTARTIEAIVSSTRNKKTYRYQFQKEPESITIENIPLDSPDIQIRFFTKITPDKNFKVGPRFENLMVKNAQIIILEI